MCQAILGPGDTAGDEIDRNPCPPGADMLVELTVNKIHKSYVKYIVMRGVKEK